MERPKGCPAPDHCMQLSRTPGDYGDGNTVHCIGLRTSNKVPGKEKALTNVPSDVIINCEIIGSHSEDAGPRMTISNVPDQYLFLRADLTALNKIGLLESTIKKVIEIDDDLATSLYGIVAIPDLPARYPTHKGSFMTMIFCEGCKEEIMRWYEPIKQGSYGEGLKMFVSCHKNLGHKVELRTLTFNGKGWDLKESVTL